MDDYYELLDVAPDAEHDDIRTAYRTNRDALNAVEGDQNKGRVAELNHAWNVLSDPAQADRYDERLAEYHASEEDGEYDEDDDDGDARPAARPVRYVHPRSEVRDRRHAPSSAPRCAGRAWSASRRSCFPKASPWRRRRPACRRWAST